MKFGRQYITREIFFFKNHADSEGGRLGPDLFPDLLIFKKSFYEIKIKWSACSILFFQKRVWEKFLHILCMLFQEKCFPCSILLTDQISLSNRCYFLRYWAICLMQLFLNQVATCFKINLIFLVKPILYMTKKPRQNFKYLENEESF